MVGRKDKMFCNTLWKTVKILPPTSRLQLRNLLADVIGREKREYYQKKRRNYGKSNLGTRFKTSKQQIDGVCKSLYKKVTEEHKEEKDNESVHFVTTSKRRKQYRKSNQVKKNNGRRHGKYAGQRLSLLWLTQSNLKTDTESRPNWIPTDFWSIGRV